MRRFIVCAGVMVVTLVTGAMAQGKIATLEDHVKLMKSNAQANGALNKAVGSGSFADARMEVTTLRQNLMTLQTFWMEKKNPEAVKIVKEGLGRLDALDKILAAPAPDQMAAQAAAKEFGGNTCGACHKMLREGDAQTGFRFQAGKSPF
jgi:mono/diheme cytochrome c family protein